MSYQSTMTVRVTHVQQVTPLVKEFTFAPDNAQELPRFSAGSHVIVHMPTRGRTFRNAYSLISPPGDCSVYRIAVRRQEPSRGGSHYMHDSVQVGDLLQITPPANLFSIDRRARRQILIAGGIGITPFMSYLQEMPVLGVPYELHYAYRGIEHAAFRDQLARELGNLLHTYDASRDEYIQPRILLSAQPLGTHVYVCGPEGLISSVVESAHVLGWPDSHVHYEKFEAAKPGAPFKVSCARRGCEIDVPSDISLLEALEAAGIPVPNLCRGGVCGQCETVLLAGDPEHRDDYLASEARGSRIMPCVSRARSTHLVLDL